MGRRTVGFVFLALFPPIAWLFYHGPGWLLPGLFALFRREFRWVGKPGIGRIADQQVTARAVVDVGRVPPFLNLLNGSIAAGVHSGQILEPGLALFRL